MMNVLQEENPTLTPFVNLGKLKSSFKNSFCVKRQGEDSVKASKENGINLRIRVESTQIE